MHARRILAFTATLLAVGSLVQAGGYSARQYYSSWRHQPSRGYHYRTYYYKPTPAYAGYRHHYVVHHPSRPQHLYYYNPYTRKYWGRCPSQAGGKGEYSLLAEKDRKGKLEEIPETAFPPMGKLPAIPESNDGESLDLPPDDLPPGLDAPD